MASGVAATGFGLGKLTLAGLLFLRRVAGVTGQADNHGSGWTHNLTTKGTAPGIPTQKPNQVSTGPSCGQHNAKTKRLYVFRYHCLLYVVDPDFEIRR